eukprot:1966020-Amphidinium_carterae.2
MLGGMDNLVVLKDPQGTSMKLEFGSEDIRQTHNLGINQMPVDRQLRMSDIHWETILQRVWPQELNFFHTDSPTRRLHCMAHYAM